MNWAIFSIVGYISVALWVCMPLLWLAHELRRPRRWFAHAAVLVGVVALVLATINSRSHVGRIAVDRSDQIEAQLSQQQSARQLAEEQRAGEAAQIRFAEDAASDRLDKAGLADADRTYFDTLESGTTPDWKKEKKQRTEGGTQGKPSDKLESLIGADSEKREGVKTEEFTESAQPQPILMSEGDKSLADRLDTVNLSVIRLLLLLGVGYLALDYVRRLNVDHERYFPLPVPSHWADAMTPRSAVASLADSPDRSIPDQLRAITRRGEIFVWVTDNPSAAGDVSGAMGRLPGGHWPIRVIDVDERSQVDDEFIFETAWHARNAFVIHSPGRAGQLLDSFLSLMSQRRETRARTRRRVHIVWDVDAPVPEPIRHRFEKLGEATGFRLLLCRSV